MVAGKRLDEALFERIALGDPSVVWELEDGVLREKPGMSVEHNDVAAFLVQLLGVQLDRAEFRVRSNSAHVRISAERSYVPDVAVVPTAMEHSLRDRPGTLETYRFPLPLVVEVWSPSTGNYDVNAKIPGYQARGDAEIWRLHPYDRTLTRWVRREDGGYDESTVAGGAALVTAASLAAPPAAADHGATGPATSIMSD